MNTTMNTSLDTVLLDTLYKENLLLKSRELETYILKLSTYLDHKGITVTLKCINVTTDGRLDTIHIRFSGNIYSSTMNEVKERVFLYDKPIECNHLYIDKPVEQVGDEILAKIKYTNSIKGCMRNVKGNPNESNK